MLEISSKKFSNYWEVYICGELDVSNCDKLKEFLNKLFIESKIDIKIDLEKLDYIDSTGLGVLISILKKLKTSNKELYLVNPKQNVEKIFNITGLDKIFNME